MQKIDREVLLILREGPSKRNKILSSLKHKGINVTDNQLRRSFDRLLGQKLIRRLRKGVYGITEKGQKKLGGQTPHEPLYSREEPGVLENCFPSEHHRATYELALDAVVSKYLLPEDEGNWGGIVAAGETQDEKTLIARSVCWTLGFDEVKFSFDLHQATPGDFGVRRFTKSEGEQGVRVSKVFSLPFVILEELDKVTNREVLRNVRYLLQGERTLNVEGNLIEVKPVPFILFNLQKGEDRATVEKILRREYISRSVVLNSAALKLDAEKVSELGEKIVRLKDEKKFPHLDLSKLEKPRKITKSENDLIRHLVYAWAKEGEKNLMDAPRVAHLVQGRLARYPKLEVKEAIHHVVGDYLLTRETLGAMQPNWRKKFIQRTGIGLKVNSEVTSKKAAPKSASKIDPESLQRKIKFREELDDEKDKLKGFREQIKETENFFEEQEIDWEKAKELIAEKGEEINFSPEKTKNALQEICRCCKKVREGNTDDLVGLKEIIVWFQKTYIEPLIEVKEQLQQYVITAEELVGKMKTAKTVDDCVIVEKELANSPLPASVKRKLGKRLKEKKTDLQEEKEAKTRALVEYLTTSDPDDLDGDITSELIQLGVIEKKRVHGEEKLQDTQGNIYNKDRFNFKKFKDDPFDFSSADEGKATALTLLTGKRHKSARDQRQEYFEAQQLKRERKAKAEAAGEVLPWMVGIGGIGALIVDCFGSRKKYSQSTPEKQTRAKFYPWPRERPLSQQRPIGRAEFFHSDFGKWIKAEILAKRDSRPSGENRYYIRWKGKKIWCGWVRETQLRQIFYFNQQN